MNDDVPLTRRAAREAREAQEALEAKQARQGGRAPDDPAVENVGESDSALTPAPRPPASPPAAAWGEPPASPFPAGPAAPSTPDAPSTPAEPAGFETTRVLGTTWGTGATEVLSTTDGAFGADGSGADGSGAAVKRSPFKGFSDAIARHPKAWMYSSLGVVFLLLGTVSVFTGIAVGSAAPVPVAQTKTPTPEPTRESPAQVLPATALRTCSIAGLAADPRLLSFAGSVINVTTGEVLYDRNGTVAAPPASGLKVITAAAALMTLGADYTIKTKVFEGTEPGSIVLVGQGDPTLSRINGPSVYSGAPKLSDLAAQAKTKWETDHPGDDITKVIIDASYWNPADSWDPTWDDSERRDGWQSHATALMVDGDRDDPTRQQSTRSKDPIARAGESFVRALDLLNPPEVVYALTSPAPRGPEIGSVSSQPMSVLIAQMLDWSDNTIAENIARIVSMNLGGAGTAASLSSLIPGLIANLGLAPQDITIRDGSGLSDRNLVPPEFMAELMAKIATGQQDLGAIKSVMPVAGKTGSLRNRFTGESEIARGKVFGKTGWILSSRTLSGWLDAQDGSVLAYSFYALGPVKSEATVALDAVTTGAFSCGNNLSNN